MKLSFHGGVRGVTGSCFLIETSKSKVLIDCGMFQGERMCDGCAQEPFGFSAQEIDAVVVTHTHYDHIGRLPRLCREGFEGPIYLTPPTKSLGKLVLEDALHVMIDNAHRTGDLVLYEEQDVVQAVSQMNGVNYHTQFDIVPGIPVMLHNAGHILGSAYATVTVPGNETKTGENITLCFSGDLGNSGNPILPDLEPIEKADIIVTESTYGNRLHEPIETRKSKLVRFASSILNHGGTLLVPAFSIERTQELLYALDELVDEHLIPSVPIYLDSPLAIKATQVYRDFKHHLEFERDILASEDRDFFSFPRLKETLSVDASKMINEDPGAKIIIAGSGMMTGGRIVHHLRRYLQDAKNGVLIIGYQAEGTLGRKIFNGAETVQIFRDDVHVKARVEAIGSFSAHADRRALTKWLQPTQGAAKKVFLVHGDKEIKQEFKTHLEGALESEILIPEFQQVVEF